MQDAGYRTKTAGAESCKVKKAIPFQCPCDKFRFCEFIKNAFEPQNRRMMNAECRSVRTSAVRNSSFDILLFVFCGASLKVISAEAGVLLPNSDLEEVGPEFAADEDALLLRIISDPVQHIFFAGSHIAGENSFEVQV
jgi:hypothetical protein